MRNQPIIHLEKGVAENPDRPCAPFDPLARRPDDPAPRDRTLKRGDGALPGLRSTTARRRNCHPLVNRCQRASGDQRALGLDRNGAGCPAPCVARRIGLGQGSDRQSSASAVGSGPSGSSSDGPWIEAQHQVQCRRVRFAGGPPCAAQPKACSSALGTGVTKRPITAPTPTACSGVSPRAGSGARGNH